MNIKPITRAAQKYQTSFTSQTGYPQGQPPVKTVPNYVYNTDSFVSQTASQPLEQKPSFKDILKNKILSFNELLGIF